MNETPLLPAMPAEASDSLTEKRKAGCAPAPGSAFPPDTSDDSLCNVRRLRAEIRMLRAALQPFAGLLDGELENVGGGTLIAPTIKVQMVKDAKDALTLNAPGERPGQEARELKL